MKKSNKSLKILLCMFLIMLLASCSNIDLPFFQKEKQTDIEHVDTDKQEQEQEQEQEVEDKDLNSDHHLEIEGKNKPTLDGTTIEIEGEQVIVNIGDILVLVNKDRTLPADYIPSDLIVPDVPFAFEGYDQKKQLKKEAAEAVEKLFKEANKSGLNLFAQSGYRSYERQEAIFAYNVKQKGQEAAESVSAHPGQSEHQTGLALDVTSPEVNGLVEAFGKTEEGKWLEANAAKFGFIIRYPKGKESITGYQYEPWHIRFVGKDVATEIMEQDITFEEYFEQ
jgi:D-alanyl-D-alanine carboxypeptidase